VFPDEELYETRRLAGERDEEASPGGRVLDHE
jgi:hypothetical protein